MNFKTFRFIISPVLLITIELSLGSPKQIPEQDKKPISNRFADLLKSLVKVNTERVNALKKLSNLYDVNGAKPLLRTAQHRKDDTKLKIVAIVIHKRNDYPKTITEHGNKRCVCDDRDADNDEAFRKAFEERAVARKSSLNDANHHYSYEPLKVDENIVLIRDKDKLSYYNDSRLSSGEASAPVKPGYDSMSSSGEVSTPVKPGHNSTYYSGDVYTPGQHPQMKSRSCMSSRSGYKGCKISCENAYRSACAKHYCKRRLYKKLGKECKYFCKKRFRRYDYYH